MESGPRPRHRRSATNLLCLIVLGIALSIGGCTRHEAGSSSPNAMPAGTLTAESLGPKSPASTGAQSDAGEFPYELVPLMEALETGRLSGRAANNLALGQMVHQNTMLKIIDGLEARRRLDQADEHMRETLDVLLRETREVRSVATHQLLVFDKKSGNIAVISKFYTDLLESGFNGYGVILPSTHWGYMPPFAGAATEADWGRAAAARVNVGRWTGAYLLNGKQILLPGFRALEQLAGTSTAGQATQAQQPVGPSLNSEAISAVRARAAAVGVRSVHIVIPSNTMAFAQEATYLQQIGRLVVWNSAAQAVYGSAKRLTTRGDGALEIGVNGRESYDKRLRAVGILEGLRDDSLYEFWPTKLVTPGTGSRSSQRLMRESYTDPKDPLSFRRGYAR